MPLFRAFIMVCAATLAACGGDDQPGPGPTLPATAQPTAANSETATAAPTVGSTQTPVVEAELPDLRLVAVFADLSFANATGLYAGPNGRLYLTEQAGRILVLEPSGAASVFLDLRDRVNARAFEAGLLGLALAPDFIESGLFYVHYSASAPRRSVVSSFLTASPLAGPADPASEAVILEVEQPFSNHNGGQIAFGPDGFLYVSLGDGGDSLGNGQNLATLLGTILRIDVSVDSGYAIPEDNPFGGSGRPQNPRGDVGLWLEESVAILFRQ